MGSGRRASAPGFAGVPCPRFSTCSGPERAAKPNNSAFGNQYREACAALIEQELAREEEDRVIYRGNLLALLRRRELARVGAQLSAELGLPYAEPYSGERIEGIYRRRLDLASGPYALIEKSREFTWCRGGQHLSATSARRSPVFPTAIRSPGHSAVSGAGRASDRGAGPTSSAGDSPGHASRRTLARARAARGFA